MKKEYKDLTVDEKKEYLLLKNARSITNYLYLVFMLIFAIFVANNLYSDIRIKVFFITCSILIFCIFLMIYDKKENIEKLYSM